MMPKQALIEVPLLQVLAEMPGGEAKPSEVYARLEKRFPELTKADLAEQLDSGGSKWTNRVQWVRQDLISTTVGFWYLQMAYVCDAKSHSQFDVARKNWSSDFDGKVDNAAATQ